MSACIHRQVPHIAVAADADGFGVAADHGAKPRWRSRPAPRRRSPGHCRPPTCPPPARGPSVRRSPSSRPRTKPRIVDGASSTRAGGLAPVQSRKSAAARALHAQGASILTADSRPTEPLVRRAARPAVTGAPPRYPAARPSPEGLAAAARDCAHRVQCHQPRAGRGVAF